MFVLKVITIFCGFVGCLTGISASNEEHQCQCDAVKEELDSLKAELGSLKEEFHGTLHSLETQNLRQKDANVKSKTVSERFVMEMDVEQEIVALKQALGHLQQGTGGTYVRWGRTVCPTSAELLYKGYTGGNHYTHTGGPGNHLCLPDDPTWAKYLDGVQAHGSTIYGTEYENNYGSSYKPFNKDVVNEDVPCAVCKTNRTNIMIPARTNCYSGWRMEYTGYLMSTPTVYAGSSEYICVDGDPEFLQHGNADENGALLYMVQGRCGSLPCGPYVEGRELACVVCSK